MTRPLNPNDPVERALLAEKRFRAVEATRSAFNPETGAYKHLGAYRGKIPGAADLANVPFPDRTNPALALFGYTHHSETAKLAHRVGQELALPEADLAAVQGAGMLHDLGRTMPWPAKDPGHQARSAELADQVMRADPSFWGDRELRETTCWLIAHHTLDRADPPTDPRLQALWDAELFESFRFGVGTREGALGMKAAVARLVTRWGRLPEHQERWRKHHGW